MKTNTFYQYCVYICICLIVFSMSIAFVNSLDVFGIEYDVGYSGGDSSNESFVELTTNQSGVGFDMGDIWGMATIGTGLVGLLLVALTRSTVIIGVYIFSAVFWMSYVNILFVVYSLLVGLELFVVIGTTAMFFAWVGAIVGMLSGSG